MILSMQMQIIFSSSLEYEMKNESYGTVEIGTGGSNTLAGLKHRFWQY